MERAPARRRRRRRHCSNSSSSSVSDGIGRLSDVEGPDGFAVGVGHYIITGRSGRL